MTFAILTLCVMGSALHAASVAFVANGNANTNRQTINALNAVLTPANGHSLTQLALNNGSVSQFSNFDALYIDSRGTGRVAFQNFVNTNRTMLENYVTNGGRVYLNVAYRRTPTPFPATQLLFGVSAQQNTGSVAGVTNGRLGQAVGTSSITNGLGGNAGTNWTAIGNNNGTNNTNQLFAPDYLTGTALNPLIIDPNTGRVQFGSLQQGSGTVWFGGLNYVSQQRPTNAARILRQNIIGTIAAPEPETWALLILGTSGMFMWWRRRRLEMVANHAA